jgi:hypothetical protein
MMIVMMMMIVMWSLLLLLPKKRNCNRCHPCCCCCQYFRAFARGSVPKIRCWQQRCPTISKILRASRVNFDFNPDSSVPVKVCDARAPTLSPSRFYIKYNKNNIIIIINIFVEIFLTIVWLPNSFRACSGKIVIMESEMLSCFHMRLLFIAMNGI